MVIDFNGCSEYAQEADISVIGLRLADRERQRFWDPRISRAHSVDNLLDDIAEDGEFVNWSLVIGDLDLFSDKMRLHCLFRYRYSRAGGNEVHSI